MGVKPHEDWQFGHHLETLMLSLTHDGRFREARELKKFCQEQKIVHTMPWFRLHLAERNWDDARKVTEQFRKNDKQTVSYLLALIYLKQGDAERARATAIETAARARDHDARRYEVLAQLAELEAESVLNGAIDGERLMSVCRALPGLAGPDAWWLAGHAAAVTGIASCAALARDLAAQLASSLPDDLTPSFERYARTRLDMTSTSGRSG